MLHNIKNIVFENSKSVHHCKRYIKLIENYTGEGEVKHHILPKSLFPDFRLNKQNIINISHRLHYILHQLLVKIFPSKQMWHALKMMANSATNKYIKYSSSLYQEATKIHKETVREISNLRVLNGTHNMQGENNPCFEKIKQGIHNFVGKSNPAKNLHTNSGHLAKGPNHWLRNRKVWEGNRFTDSSRKLWKLAIEVRSIRLKNPSLKEVRFGSLANKILNTNFNSDQY